MTIPRGYIPGKTDFPVITSATGNISFDDDNLETSGTITVINEVETQGIQISLEKIQTVGTNQNLELEANGTGEILANSNLSGKALNGVLQYKYIGYSYTSATPLMSIDEGYVVFHNGTNSIVATLPGIGASDIGKRIRIRNWVSVNSTIVQRNDSDTIQDKDSITSYTQLSFANAGDWVELAVDYTNIWKVIDKSSGVTLS